MGRTPHLHPGFPAAQALGETCTPTTCPYTRESPRGPVQAARGQVAVTGPVLHCAQAPGTPDPQTAPSTARACSGLFQGPPQQTWLLVSPPAAWGWPRGSHVHMRGTWRHLEAKLGSQRQPPSPQHRAPRSPAAVATAIPAAPSVCSLTMVRGPWTGARNTHVRGVTCLGQQPSRSICFAHIKTNLSFV